MSAILQHMVWPYSANLRCRSETCCTRLAGNRAYRGRKKVAKNRHLGTIAQLCRAISSQLRHISTIGKKLVTEGATYVRQGDRHVGHGPHSSCSVICTAEYRHLLQTQTSYWEFDPGPQRGTFIPRLLDGPPSQILAPPLQLVIKRLLWPPCVADADIIFMVALWNRADNCIFALWFLLSFFLA